MRILPLLVLSGLLLPWVAGAAGPRPGRAFLTWHAPYGAPGASDFLSVTPGDTTQEDTLYLCAEPDSESKSVYGYVAELRFHATGTDTIGPYWRMGGYNDGGDTLKPHLQREDSVSVSQVSGPLGDMPNLRVVGNYDPKLPVHTPWPRGNAVSLFLYDWSRSSGRFRITWVVPADHLFGVEAGKLYCWGRLMFRRPAADVPRAGQPICVELNSLKIIYGSGNQHEVARGDRWAAINAHDACADRMGMTATPRKAKAPSIRKPKNARR